MATRGGSSGAGGQKGDGFMEALAAVTGLLVFVSWFVWFIGSQKIVYNATPVLRWMGVPWAFISESKWTGINEAYVYFRNAPRSIPFSNFAAFANACLTPLAYIFCASVVILLAMRFLSQKGAAEHRRSFSPMQAAREISKVFPAIVPVLHLGPDLVADKLALWRRQTFPEDVWMNEKILGRPLSVGSDLYAPRVETYFRGGEVKDGPHQLRDGRRWSKMLGYLVVDLMADAKKQDTICFPDRFSSAGKVLFGILCAHAFGGSQGKKDHRKACEELNRSCAGQSNGLPNLTVAQWIYTKYRTNPDAKALFAVHHWEFTYLYALFIKAKRNGKATHTDFIWLKPLDRIMFYALNTVGRAAPPVEATSAFAIHDYENKCAIHKRLPLRMRKDGDLEANICIQVAVEGLTTEFNRYLASTADNDDWWKNLGTWGAAEKMAAQQAAMKAEMDEIRAAQRTTNMIPAEEDTVTVYDTAMSAKRKEEDQQQAAKVAVSLSGAGAGGDGGMDMV
jgi:hypothetical protein